MYFTLGALYLSIFFRIIASQKENILDLMCTFNEDIKLKAIASSISTVDGKTIHWSPCITNTSKQICPENSIVCLKEEGKPKVANLGRSFTLMQEQISNAYYLKSEDSDVCDWDTNRNYTVDLLFDEHVTETTFQPSQDRCVFRIRLPYSKTEYPCTKRENGFLLDFRRLTNDYVVNMDDRIFTFNLCRPAGGCYDFNAASCVSDSSGSTVFGDVSTRRITYENNILQFHFNKGSGKSRLNTRIEVQCNWNILYDDAKYLKGVSSNKLLKFEVQSIVGCVKLPMDCKYVDMAGNYEYDLSALYKPNEGWSVRNSLNDTTIRMNVCGPLNNIHTECKEKESQICGNVLSNTDLSYGSMLVEKRIERDIFKAKLVHGSNCPADQSRTLSTDLNWKCCVSEKGPKLINTRDCGIEILWETPEACPKLTIIKSTLNMHDHLGHRNLTGLCGDRLHKFSASSYMRFNLCSPLQETCNALKNVSACLHINQKQFVLGFYKEEKLVSRNAVISMEFSGAPCKKLKVNFVCDYLAPISGQISVNIVHDNCIYKMSVRSPRVCAAKQNLKLDNYCVVKREGLLYDLTDLTLADQNYRTTPDKAMNIEYVLNVCNPVVTQSSCLCKVDSAVCIYNQTEPSFKRRFFTIGSYPGQFDVEDDHLVLKFVNGDMCSNHDLASAKIHFYCSNEHEVGPTLTDVKKNCSYEFVWRTKYSCAKPFKNILQFTTACVFPTDTGLLDLTSVENKEFQTLLEDGTTLTFNICQENYTKVDINGNKETIPVQRKIGDTSIEFSLGKKCDDKLKSDWNILKILFVCQVKDEEISEAINVENCTAYVKCKSRSFCKRETPKTNGELEGVLQVVEKLFTYIQNRSDTPKSIQNDTEISQQRKNQTKASVLPPLSVSPSPSVHPPLSVSSVEQKTTAICSFRIDSKTIILNDLLPITMLSPSGHHYSIGSETRCDDYICMDNIPLASLKTCPNITSNTNDDVVRVLFNNTLLSNRPFSATLILKCNQTETTPQIVGESNSSLTLSYPLSDICLPTPPSNTGWIVGCAIVLTVAFVAIIVAYYFKRRKYRSLPGRCKSELYLYARNTED